MQQFYCLPLGTGNFGGTHHLFQVTSISRMGRTSRHAYFNKSIITTCRGEEKKKKVKIQGTSLGVQWLRLCLLIQGVKGSVPGQKAKISHASQPKDQNIKQSSIVNKYNKDLKMVHIKKRKKKQNFTLLSTTTCNRS